MKKNSIVLTILCLVYMGLAHSHGEMIMVESKFGDGLQSFQFRVNGENNSLCSSGTFCPKRIFINIEPNKDNIFDLYWFEPRQYHYKISDSCIKQTINVKPNSGATITIVRNDNEIVCKYIK
jgi:hypothetical protein